MTVFLPCSIPPVFATEGTRRPPRGMTSVRNEPIPRHLTALRRASCVSAALDWAKQGHQQVMHTSRDDSGQFSPIPADFAGIGETAPQTDAGQAGQESFFTQDERSALADVRKRTQQESDRYEKAGLGPDIRSGAISGAEAARRVRDPDAPKPPSQVQRLKLKLEAKTAEDHGARSSKRVRDAPC